MSGDDDPDVTGPPTRSDVGAPAVGSTVLDRFGTNEIYQRVVAYGDHELSAATRVLFASAVAAGLAISITFLAYAELSAAYPESPVLGALLYPLGFMYIILGGYQLYTENTLPPVTLVLERLASVPALLRVFGVVLAGNFVGAGLATAALFYGDVLSDDAVDAAIDIGTAGVATAPSELFVKGAFAGLIVAGVVWMDFASGDTISRLVLIYVAFLTIPVVGLYHVVVSSAELVFVVLEGEASLFTGIFEFILPVLAGNTFGGIVLVALVNYFQTTGDRLGHVRTIVEGKRLSVSEWLLGGLVGRSYVPPRDHEE